MKNIKLIVGDLDGTLVVKHNDASRRTRDVILECKKRGIYFGIASGRQTDELNLYKRWGLDEDFDLIVGLNGCQLKDNILNVENEYFVMEGQYIKEAIDVMRPFKHNPIMYVGNIFLTGEVNELVEKSLAHSDKKLVVAKDETDFYKNDNYKIMFRVKEEEMPSIEEYIKSLNLKNIKAFKTQPDLIEFSKIDVDKAITISKFCEMHNIDVKDVMTFGDTTNDNGMLKWAGVGVCMGNGSDDTKAIADYICDDVHNDGLAKFIEENVF
ncbi:MAG: HAD family hydrolase [Erysipelotrichaceae bacterium]|jgi:Cof subfamily protein (haloacid dehalogenase superfamily)